MFATTLFSNRAIALSAITLLHATSEVQAAITLSMSETRVSRDQSVVQGQKEGIVAMAGAPVDTKGADAFFALDNDGTVLTVDVGIGLGTGGSTYKMMIDSGSPNFWIASPSCQGCKIDAAIPRYTVNTTTTYGETPYNRAHLEYAIGDVSGSYKTETFSLGDHRVSNVTFVSVDEARIWPFPSPAQDVVGILPLGHGNLTVKDASGIELEVPSPLQALYRNGSIDSPVCGIFLSQDKPQLTIGGVDESLTWNEAGKVILPSVTDVYHYEVPLANALVMGNATVNFPNDTAIFDTGSSHIFGPWDAVESIYKSLQGIFFHDLDSDDKSSYYALPCQAPENFSFSFGFGGKQFPVPYEALVDSGRPVQRYVNGQLAATQPFVGWCHGNLQNTSMFGWTSEYDNKDRHWLMGLPFLRTVYSSWNFDSGEVILWPLDGATSSGSKMVESNATATATATIQGPPLPELTNGTASFVQTQTMAQVNASTTTQDNGIATGQVSSATSAQGAEYGANITAYPGNYVEPSSYVTSSAWTGTGASQSSETAAAQGIETTISSSTYRTDGTVLEPGVTSGVMTDAGHQTVEASNTAIVSTATTGTTTNSAYNATADYNVPPVVAPTSTEISISAVTVESVYNSIDAPSRKKRWLR